MAAASELAKAFRATGETLYRFERRTGIPARTMRRVLAGSPCMPATFARLASALGIPRHRLASIVAVRGVTATYGNVGRPRRTVPSDGAPVSSPPVLLRAANPLATSAKRNER